MTPFISISITVKPPAEMRYQTVGDWQVKDGVLVVTVADSGNHPSNMAVGLHEAIEAILFLNQGGCEDDVDNFDMDWDNDKEFDEPGDDPKAPYHHEHVLATIIERMLIHDLGMTWESHSDNVEFADKAVEKARRQAKKP